MRYLNNTLATYLKVELKRWYLKKVALKVNSTKCISCQIIIRLNGESPKKELLNTFIIIALVRLRLLVLNN